MALGPPPRPSQPKPSGCGVYRPQPPLPGSGRSCRIGHIQFADNPGRHEPGTGGIDYPAVFAALDRLGYDGWAAAEYWPSRTTEETLGWMTGAG